MAVAPPEGSDRAEKNKQHKISIGFIFRTLFFRITLGSVSVHAVTLFAQMMQESDSGGTLWGSRRREKKTVGPVAPNGAFGRRVVRGFGGDRANMVRMSVEEIDGERENKKERKREREV